MLERFTGVQGEVQAIEALRHQLIVGEGERLAEAIHDSSEIMEFPPGSVIIRESAPDNDIFFILAGEVSIEVRGRRIAVRTAGQHMGEMSLIEPAEPRSAAAVAADTVVVATMTAHDFSHLADSNPRLWRNVARQLADRLRQRNQFVRPANTQPILFIGCSVESLSIAQAIQSALDHDPVTVRVWTNEVFHASTFTIESLEQQLREVDFAAIVLSPDDTVISREVTSEAPRDNLILELGLFIGAIGHQRVFAIHPRDAEIKIPTDLLGLTPLTYRPNQLDGPSVAVAATCNELRNIINSMGPR